MMNKALIEKLRKATTEMMPEHEFRPKIWGDDVSIGAAVRIRQVPEEFFLGMRFNIATKARATDSWTDRLIVRRFFSLDKLQQFFVSRDHPNAVHSYVAPVTNASPFEFMAMDLKLLWELDREVREELFNVLDIP